MRPTLVILSLVSCGCTLLYTFPDKKDALTDTEDGETSDTASDEVDDPDALDAWDEEDTGLDPDAADIRDAWDTKITDTSADDPAWEQVDTSPDPTDPFWEPDTPDGTAIADTDGDTIRDVDEGGGAVDTDSDGTPDSLDEDSDDDGIPDSVEAGDGEAATPPLDTDGDDVPDYRDADSDDDTIRDQDEGVADIDADGTPNYIDLDSDGDHIDDSFEAGDTEPATAPFDHDGDGSPDYLDGDSDDDTISDNDESTRDTCSNGNLDFITLDSDSDTVPDSLEAGDIELSTPPRDCDSDLNPDYRDIDSDNDGLTDGEEYGSSGTDVCEADSDGDGVSDLAECAYGSDPLDSSDTPSAHGDIVVLSPYSEPPSPVEFTMTFDTGFLLADVSFIVDSSTSMADEVESLQSTMMSMIIPGIASEIPDVWFGVGRFQECDGATCSHDMAVIQQMTASSSAIQTALNTISVACGTHVPYTQMLYALASGDVSPFDGWEGVEPLTWSCPDASYVGWPCFRSGSLPVVIQFGDRSFDDGVTSCTPSRSVTDAVDALDAIHAKYIGINSGSARADMTSIANGTSSVDIGGSPLVIDIPSDGTGLGEAVVDAVAILASQVPMRVDALAVDDPSDSVDAVEEFISIVSTRATGEAIWDPTRGLMSVCTDIETQVGGASPVYDHFPSAQPNTSTCFDVVPRTNTTIPEMTATQVYKATVRILGDQLTVLDERDFYFLVPPDLGDQCPH